MFSTGSYNVSITHLLENDHSGHLVKNVAAENRFAIFFLVLHVQKIMISQYLLMDNVDVSTDVLR